MPKPGRLEESSSDEIDNFVGRTTVQDLYLRTLASAEEPPALMFYGVGGAGKSWLLKKCEQITPSGVPRAKIDFDPDKRGQRFRSDPAAALYDISQQLGVDVPTFTLAYSVMRQKQGASAETGIWVDIAQELLGAASPVPGISPLVKVLSTPVLSRLKGTPIERFLYSANGDRFALEVRRKSSQQLDNLLLGYLASDLRQNLPRSLDRAASAVIFFDTFEAIDIGLANLDQRRLAERWVQEIVTNFDFALCVLAGQNRLDWAIADPAWDDPKYLIQESVEGLTTIEARYLLDQAGILDLDVQEAILASSQEGKSLHHCFTLALCLDIAKEGQRGGHTLSGSSMRFKPRDWESLAGRFFKALPSANERRWIERLSLTPWFDEAAARTAYSPQQGVAQDFAFDVMQSYSFIDVVKSSRRSWSVRREMSWAIRNQPSASKRAAQDHPWWKSYWTSRSSNSTDECASLAWFHAWSLDPTTALDAWVKLAQETKVARPPRLREHFALLQWWEPVRLLELPPSLEIARALRAVAMNLLETPLGNKAENLGRAAQYCEKALTILSETETPILWATAHVSAAEAWRQLLDGNPSERYKKSIEHAEASLRVFSEVENQDAWCDVQILLGTTWSSMPVPDHIRAEHHLRLAEQACDKDRHPFTWAKLEYGLAKVWAESPRTHVQHLDEILMRLSNAESVLTEDEYPFHWASVQALRGTVYSTPLDFREYATEAVNNFERALRYFTKVQMPFEYAKIKANAAWAMANQVEQSDATRAGILDGFAEALRIYDQRFYAIDWARTKHQMGTALLISVTDEQTIFLAIRSLLEAATVFTSKYYPHQWLHIQHNLMIAYRSLPGGNDESNLRKAIEHCKKSIEFMQDGYERECVMEYRELAELLISFKEEDHNEEALEAYETAIAISAKLQDTKGLADTKYRIGRLYYTTSVGERAENLRHSLEQYAEALSLFQIIQDVDGEGRTHNDLGLAQHALATVLGTKDLTDSISHFGQAIYCFEHLSDTEGVANAKVGLASALHDSATGSEPQTQRLRIDLYESALEFYTKKDQREQWASIQGSLALAWVKLLEGNRSENLGRAIECSENELTVYTEAENPERWSRAKAQLGVSLYDLYSKEHKPAILLRAEECFTAAARNLNAKSFPGEAAGLTRYLDEIREERVTKSF